MQNVILLKIHKAIHFHGDYCKFVYTKMSWADCRMAKTKRKFIVGIYSCLNQVISRSYQLILHYTLKSTVA